VVAYWKRARLTPADDEVEVEDEATSAEAASGEGEKLPWDDLLKQAGQDELFQEAVKLVVETGRASTTFLQRRLGIGYPRASRLIDQLESEGIIGPADGTSAREVLWAGDE